MEAQCRVPGVGVLVLDDEPPRQHVGQLRERAELFERRVDLACLPEINSGLLHEARFVHCGSVEASKVEGSGDVPGADEPPLPPSAGAFHAGPVCEIRPLSFRAPTALRLFGLGGGCSDSGGFPDGHAFTSERTWVASARARPVSCTAFPSSLPSADTNGSAWFRFTWSTSMIDGSEPSALLRK